MRLLLILATSLALTGFKGLEKNSEVKGTVTKQGKSLQVQVHVKPSTTYKPKKGFALAMNYKGPFSLKVKESNGLKVAKSRLNLKDFDRKKQTFSFNVQPDKKKNGALKMEVVAFVCEKNIKTKETGKCFRDVHELTLNWKA